jgi:thiol-disulfide isomerase/thioredoxin
MKKLQTYEQFLQMKAEGKHLFLFSADWCRDCKVIEPILPEMEAKFPEFTWVYVDRDEFIDLCGELSVFGIPSFIAYENNHELGRFVSKDRKTQEEIETFIEAL